MPPKANHPSGDASTTHSAGLGIDFGQKKSPHEEVNVDRMLNVTENYKTQFTATVPALHGHLPDSSSELAKPSSAAWKRLSQAERGGFSRVNKDFSNLDAPPSQETSDSLAQRIPLVPVSSFDASCPEYRTFSVTDTTNLLRHGTLLTTGASPSRNAAELKTILGNSSARLKSGATIITAPSELSEEDVTLEQAKPRARVEVDIILESNTCVQGGYLRGQIKVQIRKRTKKEPAVKISGGKVRVIGFECILNDSERFIFYQTAAPLSDVTADLDRLYESDYDIDGFARAKEGVHVLPFALHLPHTESHGVPKGILQSQSSVSIRYIAMVFVSSFESFSYRSLMNYF